MNDLKKIKFIKFSDIAGIFLFVLFLIPSLILKLKYKITNKKLWLVTELKDTARDNGYHFFKYMRKIHPDEKCYYAINKDCKDFQKIKNMGNIIEFSSIKYWIYYMAADKNITYYINT
jgi:CDP-glycerol glycerophosphotransferase (TagB/SpsB family)